MDANDHASVESLAPAEAVEAIETLALAFDADPMFRFLLPDDRTRLDWLRFVFGATLALSMPERHVFAVKDGGIAGVVQMVPPGRHPPPFGRLASYVLRAWTRPRLRVPTTHLARRGFEIIAAMERLHLKEPHWYVMVFGVHPAHQGRGRGRLVFDQGLALADRDGLPAYLETTNEKNLGLYRRFGFDVVEEVVLPGGFPPLWTMLRPARR